MGIPFDLPFNYERGTEHMDESEQGVRGYSSLALERSCFARGMVPRRPER